MRLALKTAPGVEPVSLASAKAHCRIDGADEDALLSTIISAARGAAEHALGRRLISQVWYAFFDAWNEFEWRNAGAYAGPALVLRGLSPVSAIAGITYLDQTGATIALPSTEYALMAGGDGQSAFVVQAFGKTWPTAQAFPEAIRVEAACGYGADEVSIPAGIRAWMLLLIGAMYEFREADAARAIARVPFADSLLDPFRIAPV